MANPTSIPRVRCPVCGMLCYFRNLDKVHELDSFVVQYLGKVSGTGKGKGSGSGSSKGNIVWNKVNTIGPNTIEEFWIKHLLKVLKILGYKMPKRAKLKADYKTSSELGLGLRQLISPSGFDNLFTESESDLSSKSELV